MRLTFVGDIALDKPLLRAAKIKDGEYDFSRVFRTEDVFSESDLVVGNLETCFGGGKKYNRKPYHYNSPDCFCLAIKQAGIDLVSTANNHCLDEGLSGLKRTNRVLDDNKILHTGTFSESREKRYLIKNVKGITVAFYSLTASVNKCFEALCCDDISRYVNVIGFKKPKRTILYQRILHQAVPKILQITRKLRKKSTISARKDTFKTGEINKQWVRDIKEQMRAAKSEADYLIVLLHSGGQFNTEPGEFSEYLMDMLSDFGADVIIGNHSHTVQRVEIKNEKVIAYSLGGYCMSVSGEYVVHDCLPEYSLALHLDIDATNKEIKCSADILKGVEDEKGYLTISRTEDDLSSIIRKRCKIQ